MKKVLPYIFITLIIANLFAPVSVGLDRENNFEINKSEAEASFLEISLQQNKVCSASFDISFLVKRLKTTTNHGIAYVITDKRLKLSDAIEGDSNNIGKVLPMYIGQVYPFIFSPAEQGDTKIISIGSTDDFGIAEGTTLDKVFPIGEINKFKDGNSALVPGTTYFVSYVAFNGTSSGIPPTTDSFGYQLNTSITTLGKDDPCNTEVSVISSASGGGYLPSCFWAIGLSVSGCIAQFLYIAAFQPTSFLFGLAGKFFDYTFYYSVSDTSYRSSFVLEGWGLVRDFVNLFFIFVLLYIAFATILNLHGFKTKEMIINVVIIGLLINFSLFATQVIIDSSNILARVFYNSINTSELTKDGTPKSSTKDDLGLNKEKQLSASLVNIVNPQRLIIKASAVGQTQKQGDQAQTGSTDNGISNGTFILVTLLASAVNVVGIIVFLTSGLLFLARVIGLWLAMVFVPFAFFSYTVPAMQDIDMLGWKKWWPQTLKLSFLAPIFIFFIYLIVKFASMKDFLPTLNGDGGAELIISIIFPFAFLMILLMQAKSLAKKFSGDIGSAVTKAAVVGGGLALGGAALGAAFAGRKVIGGTMAKASQGTTATQKYEAAAAHARDTGDRSMLDKLNWHQKLRGSIGSGIGLGKVYGRTDGTYDTTTRQKNMQIKSGLGALLNKKQASVEAIDHARHEVDAVKDKRYKGTDWSKLSGTQRNNVREDYIKDNKSKFAAETEEAYRIRNGKTPTELLSETERAEVNNEIKAAAGAKFDHELEEAAKAVSGFARAVSRSNTGSYDVRNLSQTKVDKREGLFTRMGAGLIAGIALGVRTGLKSGGINHGSGQNDFLKDLGHTITEALKSAKINVKVEESHGKGGSDAHNPGKGGH
jgi:hypothetical protein